MMELLLLVKHLSSLLTGMDIICIKNHYVLNLPFSFMFHLALQLLYGLAALEEDTVRAHLGVSLRLDSGDL